MFSGVRLGIREIESVTSANVKRMLRAMDWRRVSVWMGEDDDDACECLIDCMKAISRGRMIGPKVKSSVLMLVLRLASFMGRDTKQQNEVGETYVDQGSILLTMLASIIARCAIGHR